MVFNKITELFAKLKDGSGNSITSTDLGEGKRGIDISGTINATVDKARIRDATDANKMLVVDANGNIGVVIFSSGVAIDPRQIRALTSSDVVKAQLQDNSGNGITSTDRGSGKRGLDVNIFAVGSSLRYEKMTASQAIGNGVWTSIYSYSGSGTMFFTSMAFNTNNIDIRVTLDGTVIVDTFNLSDLQSNYGLGISGTYPMLPRWIYTWNSGNNIALEFGTGGTSFTTSFLIEAKAYLAGRTLNRGLVVRST